MKNISNILINEEEAGLKDSIVRVFFSNFVVRAEGKGKQQRRDITHKLYEPWEGFVKSDNFVRGRQEATNLELLEPLVNSILEDWDFTVVREQFGSLDKLFEPAYNMEYAY